MIGMKESEWIEIFPPTHDILNLEPCVWRPVWDKWRLVVPSCGAPSQNSGYLEWKVNDCQEAICRENWSNTWAIWKNKAHPWPKKKQSKLQSMSSRCNLWSSGTMVQTARPDWANHCVSCQLSISLKQVWSEIEELRLWCLYFFLLRLMLSSLPPNEWQWEWQRGRREWQIVQLVL